MRVLEYYLRNSLLIPTLLKTLTKYGLSIVLHKEVYFIGLYMMFREMLELWLVRMSSLYFHKSRALHHMSVLLRYGACSLHHQCERMQFTIYLKKKKKNTCSSSIVDLSTWEFLGTLEKCKKHLPLACASPLFPLVFKNSRMLVKLNNVLSANH